MHRVIQLEAESTKYINLQFIRGFDNLRMKIKRGTENL